ncbi:MAG TPA: MnhB domain-containing protein [Acidimicrobiales bacterium]|nr:MnhB domain-containing protein [Acidimicrobiales bacterium]
MTPPTRRLVVTVALAGTAAFVVWGLTGLPPFGGYRGPYGFRVNAVAVGETHATGIVSAVNFFYRGFDTVGEEYILFIAATGVATVLRRLRGEDEKETDPQEPDVPPTSEAVRMFTLALLGFVFVMGWFLASHAQTSPAGGFQGGVVSVTAVLMIYLAGQYLRMRRLSPIDLLDAVEAAGAGGFAAVGIGALATGAAYLADVLPLGNHLGAVNSSGTIVLISLLVGVEVTAAFLVIVSELLEQTLLVGGER